MDIVFSNHGSPVVSSQSLADISTNCSFLVTDYVSLVTLGIRYVTIKVVVLITQTELVHILLKLQSVV